MRYRLNARVNGSYVLPSTVRDMRAASAFVNLCRRVDPSAEVWIWDLVDNVAVSI